MIMIATEQGEVNLCDVAVQYVRMGLSVIPTRNKRPALPSWREYQQRLPSEVNWEFWCFGDFNGIGLVLDRATWECWPNLWVLDIEAPYRPQAEAWLKGVLDRTAAAESISGGLHLYFLAPRPVQSTCFAWGDILGRGRIVNLPPSGWGGRAYRWIRPLEGPERLLCATPADLNLPGLHTPATEERAYDAILRRQRIPEGGRNVALTSFLGLLWQSTRLSPDEIWRVALYVNEHCFEPPLPIREARDTWRSVLRYPRTPSPRPMDPETQKLLSDLLVEAGLRPETGSGVGMPRTGRDILNSAGGVEWVPCLGKPGVLMRGGITLIAAEPGAGKTTLAWAVVQDILRSGGKALYLSEDPESIWRDRLSICDPESLDRVFIAIWGADANALDGAIEAQAEAVRPDVIVVDTFRVWTPVEDENSAAQVNARAETIRRLARNTNAAVLVLHHISDATGKVAGSHVFRAFPDVVYEFRRGKSWNVRILRAVKSRPSGALTFGVLTYDPAYGYRWMETRPPSAWEWGAPRPPNPPPGAGSEEPPKPDGRYSGSGGGLSTRAIEILALLQTRGPMSADDVARALGYSRAYARKWLKELQRAGEAQIVRPGSRGRGRTTLYAPCSPSGGETEKMALSHGYVISEGSTPQESATDKANGHECHFMSATEADSGENGTRETENGFRHECHFTAYSHADLRPKMALGRIYKNIRVPKTGTRIGGQIEGQGVCVSQGENETRPEPEDMHACPPEPADTLSAFADTSPGQPTPPPTTLTQETKTQKTEDACPPEEADDFPIWAIWTIEMLSASADMPNTRKDSACPFPDCPYHTRRTRDPGSGLL